MEVFLSEGEVPPGPREALELYSEEGVLPKITQLFNQYGDVYRVLSPSRGTYTYVISDPEMVKQVLITKNRNYEKGLGIERVKILLGNGIMVSEGDYWKRQRRMIQPSFHKKVIERLTVDMKRINQKMIERWIVRAKTQESINLTEELSDVTLEIVLKAIFSVSINQLKDDSGKHPFSILTEEHSRDLSFAMKFRALSSAIKKVMHDRRNSGNVEDDFLSMMMEAQDPETGERMTDKEIIDETMTLIVAGHETTASALTWTWYLLHKNPHVYKKAKREVAALGELTPGFELLPRLGYIKQIIEEAMRLYPPGWLLTRRAVQEDRIGSYVIPAGSDIFVSPYLIQRHPVIWEDPERFNPERFHPTEQKQRHRFAYFPFSGGPRQCIGDVFALVEMQLHVAMVLQQADIEVISEEPVELEAQINLRPKEAFLARVKTE